MRQRAKLGEAPQLLKVGESGEFKRGTLGESKESYRIETYGRDARRALDSVPGLIVAN